MPEAVAAGRSVPPAALPQVPEWAQAEEVGLARRTQQDECESCECDGASAMAFPIWASMPAVVFLVMMSGLFSGLTLGLMGLDVIQLEVVKKGEDRDLARCAEKILPVREKGNMLLCTLLFGNVAVNSALSIISGELFSGPVGFVVSTGLIVVFGEILPQAACSRYALQVGARTVLVVHFLMAAFFVLTKPMSMVLDFLLGREMGTIFSSSELMEMLKMQIELGATDRATGEIAKRVAEGALCFRDKRVHEVMIPLEDAYMLSSELRLDYNMIREIFMTGFSRVPVYGFDKNDYRGLLYTKDLMLADPDDEMKLGDFIAIFDRRVESVSKETPLVELIVKFQKGKTHMALVREPNVEVVTDPQFEICGVLTLEDIVEEILQTEIVDETDVYVDVDRGVKVSDGRETKRLNLEIFNPVWRMRKERPSREEVSAIAAHLSRTVFTAANGMGLGIRTVEWLVAASDVLNRERQTPMDVDEPVEEDWLYMQDCPSDRLCLVLQGRVGLRHGLQQFRSEAGAFSVLAQHALKLDDFMPDFGAFLATPKVRWLSVSRSAFIEARRLDTDAEALEKAHRLVRAEAARPSLTTSEMRQTLPDGGAGDVQMGSTWISASSPPHHSRGRGPRSTSLVDSWGSKDLPGRDPYLPVPLREHSVCKRSPAHGVRGPPHEPPWVKRSPSHGVR